jgi:hypothetical protein
MSNFPSDLIKVIDEHKYPKDTDWYKSIAKLPEIGVSEDYIQACTISILEAFPVPEAKPVTAAVTEAKLPKTAQNG